MQEIFAGRERHSSARYDNRGYPQRIIRTDKYLFIRNYHPEYWPSGDPQVYRNDSTLGEMHQAYLDIDDSPTLAYYRKTNTKDQSFLPLFLAAVDKRPAEELYDIIKDPACMNNLAGKQEFENVRKQLSERLASRLKETGDTRLTGPDPEIWESYPRLRGDIRKFVNAQKAGISDGLVGHWEFNDLTGKDLSGNGNDAVLNANSIYSLGTGQACIQLMPEADPVKIWVNDNSPLAISRGTICFWLNAGWTDETFLSFNNDAVQLNIYRGDFMVRFNGENEFRYENEILDYDWPEYDMREWAFYGHPRAAVGDQQWHHFAVSYDDEGKRIIGWRDGQLNLEGPLPDLWMIYVFITKC
jgi:hypothetical protein